jgi:hypothetical protein
MIKINYAWNSIITNCNLKAQTTAMQIQPNICKIHPNTFKIWANSTQNSTGTQQAHKFIAVGREMAQTDTLH